ncbi:outer membrane beta-barrel protein [Ruegeria halocynthiae]|uniref:outer membrane beta-barrel protein n=1 Tax=Ruegeria halocynthiae TaxID=985054 RepID=UPI000A8A47EF|nr:outer membrane beta-barrel protein [Ruegeria halocynthiae]
MISATGMKGAALGTALIASAATMTSAQQSDWSYDATIYLFTPETETKLETPLGTVDGTLKFSDALKNLDFAFMGAIAATNGRWSFMADYNYTNLSFDDASPTPANAELDVSVKTQFLTAMAGYRIHEDQTVKLDLAGGLRWYSTKTDFTLTPGTAPARRNVADDSWVDPVIGARARFSLSEKWASTAYLDYGGFRSGSQTWQVLVTADYIINERWMLRGGYRYISFDHDIDGNTYEFIQSGPVFGATYRF